jgi:hypothetical protein
VHRKRSQVAVAGEDRRVQLNRNVVNGSQPLLGLLGGVGGADGLGVDDRGGGLPVARRRP